MTESRAQSIAAIGLSLLILAVTATGRPIAVGPLSADTVVLGTPLAILLCLPYVRARGIATAPRYLLGPAALVFLLMAVLSVAVNGAKADSFLTIVRYASYLLLALVVSVGAQDARFRRLLLWVIALSGAATVVLAYSQFLNPPPLIPGEAYLGEDIKTRVAGTFYNSNFYAEYLVLLAGVVIALFLTEKGRGRIIAGALGIAGAVALFLTYTRGSWIALLAGLIVLILLTDIRYLALLAAAGAAAVVAVPGVLTRLSASTANEKTASFRLGLWKVAGETIKRHPILGVGIGDFLVGYREVVTTRPDLYVGYLGFGAHNAYFALAAEIGVLGGLAFLVLTVVYATKGLFVATRADVSDEVRYCALGLSVGLIGFVVNTFTSNTFQHPQAAVFFWIIAGIVAGLGAGVWRSEVRPQRALRPVRDGLLGGSVFTALVGRVRNAVDTLWRESFVFSRVAVPERLTSEWFSGSLFMRVLFGTAGTHTAEKNG